MSLWPVVALYCIWIPLTLMGRLDPSNDPLSFSKDYRDGDGAGDMLLPRPFKTDIDIALEEGNTEKSQKNISKVRSYPPSYNVQEKCITTHRKSRISSTVRSDVITNIISSESEDVTDALTNTTAAYSG